MRNYLFNKKIFLTILCLILSSLPVHPEQIFNYKRYDAKTGNILDKSYLSLGDVTDQGRKSHWEIVKGDSHYTEDTVLNSDYETLSWKVKDSDHNTEYTASKHENIVEINGLLNNKEIKKRIVVKDYPFYFNPKFGLMGFVKSDKKKITFWTLRDDTLEKYLMKATKKGLKIINVNGKKIRAIEVSWGLPGAKSMFFSRIYWFRESDGLYTKSKGSNNQVRELID